MPSMIPQSEITASAPMSIIRIIACPPPPLGEPVKVNTMINPKSTSEIPLVRDRSTRLEALVDASGMIR